MLIYVWLVQGLVSCEFQVKARNNGYMHDYIPDWLT